MKNGKESTSASALSIQSVILIPLIRFSLLAYCILTNTVQFSLIALGFRQKIKLFWNPILLYILYFKSNQQRCVRCSRCSNGRYIDANETGHPPDLNERQLWFCSNDASWRLNRQNRVTPASFNSHKLADCNEREKNNFRMPGNFKRGHYFGKLYQTFKNKLNVPSCFTLEYKRYFFIFVPYKQKIVNSFTQITIINLIYHLNNSKIIMSVNYGP